MRYPRPFPLAVLFVAIVGAHEACNAAILTPATGPGTAYPCGINGTSCGNHKCCDAPFVVCGGPFTGCVEGECCMDDNDLRVSFYRDGGKTTRPQRDE